MARDFDGATDRIDYASIGDYANAAQSFSFWLSIDTSVTVSQYYVTGHTAADAAPQSIIWTNSARPTEIEWNTGACERSGIFGLSTSAWYHVCATWDGSTTASNIHIYKNGTEVSYSATTNGTSAAAQTGQDSLMGRITDDARCADGQLAAFGRWNRVLSAGEITGLAKGFAPAFFPNGLIRDIPLVRTANDARNGVGTLDGTTVYPHPRIITPWKEMVGRNPTPAAAGGIIPQVYHHRYHNRAA